MSVKNLNWFAQPFGNMTMLHIPNQKYNRYVRSPYPSFDVRNESRFQISGHRNLTLDNIPVVFNIVLLGVPAILGFFQASLLTWHYDCKQWRLLWALALADMMTIDGWELAELWWSGVYLQTSQFVAFYLNSGSNYKPNCFTLTLKPNVRAEHAYLWSQNWNHTS